jgi:putative ABC transport system permease protein
MNRIALVSLFRSLSRNRLYAALNIGGLALGIAVFVVLGLFVRFETGFERWVPEHDEVYLVENVWKIPDSPMKGAYFTTMGGLLEQLRQSFPGTVGTRIRGGRRGDGSVLREGAAIAESVAQVDPSFFDVFALPMASGTGKGALDDPNAMLLSESAARRYFGGESPIGQTLTISVEGAADYRVAGVFKDLPPNTEFTFNMLVPLPTRIDNPHWYQWGSGSLLTFLRFPDREAARAYEERLPAFVDRFGRRDIGEGPSSSLELRLLPLGDWHLTPEGPASASRRLTVVTLGMVGLLTLLIAVLNYVNLATAQAGLRAREVAVRKVLGATHEALMRQFLVEAIAIVGVAALLGLVLAEIGLPLINAAGGLTLAIPYVVVVPGLVVLSLVVGVLAGFYPAVLLARFQPAAVLASSRTPGGGRAGTRLREALVVVQFGLAIAAMIGTGVLFAQIRHVREADVGFAREGLITLLSTRNANLDPRQRRALLQATRALPNVREAGFASAVVGGSGSSSADNVPLPGEPGEGPSLSWEIVGPGFFDVYGPRLLAGRLFDSSREADDLHPGESGRERNIVINRQAVTALHFASPDAAVGKTVGGDRPRTIIGVVDDLRFDGPREPVSPTYYYFQRDAENLDSPVLSARFTGDPRVTERELSGVWQRVAPQVAFEAETADTRLAEFYRDDERTTRLFAIGAALAVLIGCIGLWGLASFNTARRVKEIGIRKALGASSGDVVKLLVGQFLRPVLIGNLIAWPFAWLAMQAWLAGFAERITLSPLFFIAASALAIAIALCTVLAQAARAGRLPPAVALRHD